MHAHTIITTYYDNSNLQNLVLLESSIVLLVTVAWPNVLVECMETLPVPSAYKVHVSLVPRPA